MERMCIRNSENREFMEFAKNKSKDILLSNESDSIDETIKRMIDSGFAPEISPVVGDKYETGVL